MNILKNLTNLFVIFGPFLKKIIVLYFKNAQVLC